MTTSPFVALAGVKPVVPALKDNTPVLVSVIVPAPLVTVMPSLTSSVLSTYPLTVSPISSCPLVGNVLKPVPPFSI